MHAASVRAILHQPADVDRMKPVDVLVWGLIRSKTRRSASSPHRRRERRLHEDAVVHIAAVQAIDELEELVQPRGRGQSLDVGPEPVLAADFSLPPT